MAARRGGAGAGQRTHTAAEPTHKKHERAPTRLTSRAGTRTRGMEADTRREGSPKPLYPPRKCVLARAKEPRQGTSHAWLTSAFKRCCRPRTRHDASPHNFRCGCDIPLQQCCNFRALEPVFKSSPVPYNLLLLVFSPVTAQKCTAHPRSCRALACAVPRAFRPARKTDFGFSDVMGLSAPSLVSVCMSFMKLNSAVGYY